MNRDDQIYVKYGDFIQLHVEHLQGTVCSQGFSNRNCYLQMNPPRHQECFTRNKRDFCFQIVPRLAFDARKDYQSALKFFEKNFGAEQEAPDAGAEKQAPNAQEATNNDGEAGGANASRASATSFLGRKGPRTAAMTPGMKKDRDNFKKRLQQLERKLKDEDAQNQKIFAVRKGEFVAYGNELQLLHVDSCCYMQATKQCADEDNSCNKVELATHGSKSVWFKALGGFKYKQEGDRIHYNDQIVLQNIKTGLFLHVTEKLLKVEGLEGSVPEPLRSGQELITPKKIDRRDPPSAYVPQCELNVSTVKAKFQIQIYRYFDEDPDEQFVKGGCVVRLLHSERGGFLHSDDKDFTDDGLAEVYLWNFKGKSTDLEALSSSSLFELEVASPLAKTEPSPVSPVKGADAQPRQDVSERAGRVYCYSSQGGLAASKQGSQGGDADDVQYRLRHLNTGRLVVDQEIEYGGVRMRTLGLAPHLVAKNLAQLSEKQVEQVQQELKDLDVATNYKVVDWAEGSPQTYAELDRRSRFRIISTSPSLDTRIQASSCVQIQHVASERYLSYETKTTFQAGVARASDARPAQDEEARKSQTAGSRLAGDGSDRLYWPVDDDDIQAGSRDAVELKPARSNEDAFFVIPENPSVLQSILFIQTAIDLLKKYLPTICSRNLEISKEKQTKILDGLDRIEEFLVGDTRDSFAGDGDQDLPTGFSKDENDLQLRRQENLRLRQKLMRELYIVESLVHIIYLPFAHGDFNLQSVRGADVIARVCQKAYNLIKTIALGYYQNELYVSQWLNLYFHHAMSTNSVNNIGAEETIISLVDNNKKLLEIQITPAIIGKFVNLCRVQNRQRRLIQLLKAICSCLGEPVVNNQNDIAAILLEDAESRTFLMMPVRMRSEGAVDVLMDSGDGGRWAALSMYRKFKRDAYGYLLSLLDLSAELCLGRNNRALTPLQDMYSFDTVKVVVKDRELPYEMRALFMRILLHMHMDREPLEPIQIPSSTGVWNELPPFIKEQFLDPTNLVYQIKQAKIAVPSSLSAIKKFVENYLHETHGVQNIFQVGKNMMTLEILKIIKFMLAHGFYTTLRELKEVARPMINLLDGSNDIYCREEEVAAGSLDDFLSVKRYFSSGDNDVIVQSKAIICENLLTISQLETDGKAQIFLSKFKADQDALFLQRQMQAAAPHRAIAAKQAQDQQQKRGGCLQRLKFSLGKVTAEEPAKLSSKQLESQNIEFLEQIAGAYNFEADGQDAYICVLFDLLLYKYPLLAKGVFELLVRLFTRKRTLLETLLQIQMLENPKSIQVLGKVKVYHAELRRLIEDADQWLNKSNTQSKKAKRRVTEIFAFYARICRADADVEGAGDTPLLDVSAAAGLPAEEPEAAADQTQTCAHGDAPRRAVSASNAVQSKVNQRDFILFEEVSQRQNKENQRLLGSFGIENLAMFFIKYRVDRNSVNDPVYQQLIHQCYHFLVMYVRDNLQNQIKVHDNLEIFLRDIDKNPLICLLLYELFKDNKRFLTLNVSKILRQIILSAEEASLQSSKKALYLKLLEVFCKFEDKLVRPNQQEIVINFTRDISKNNLIYLFSTEGLPHLIKLVQDCLPARFRAELDGPADAGDAQLPEAPAGEPACAVSIEVFNVVVCLNLMSTCCEGKSDLAEIKCQNEIIDVHTALVLYRSAGRLWPFKCSLLKYVSHCYLDSGNPKLFSAANSNNTKGLEALLELVRDDMVRIHEEWHLAAHDCVLVMPDGRRSSFSQESKQCALGFVPHFFKSCLRNKRIDLGVDLFPCLHTIAANIAKMYYSTTDEQLQWNAMDVLSFINNSERYARLLENVQHPANQNIYVESQRMGAGAKNKESGGVESGQKSSQLSGKLMQLTFSSGMAEQKEREFEVLVLWVTNIDQRINNIMAHAARGGQRSSERAFANVSYDPIVSSFMTLLDSKCLGKELHVTGLTLLRKIVEVENKELVTPAADWRGDEWEPYQKIIAARQNSLVAIGCIEFLCKHLQDVDDDEVLEQTFLVCITLLLGGNKKSQDAFFHYFQHQDQRNTILMKLKRLLMEQFDLTKKFIGEKNAKLAMIYKVNQREAQRQKPAEGAAEGDKGRGAEGAEASDDDENLLTIDQSMHEDGGAGGQSESTPVDEMFLVDHAKHQSIVRCMRLLRFLQLLTEGHHTELQNFLREQVYGNGVVNQKSFDFVSYVAQMLGMYEKQFVNCYSCALGGQLVGTLIEVVQGPCPMNQRRLVEAKIIDCSRDLIQQGQQSESELRIRGFVGQPKADMHDALKMQAVKLLLSLIEGAVDADVYRQLADSLDDFVILKRRLETIYERFVVEDLRLPRETSTNKQVDAALRKDSFLGRIFEGFDIYCLINQLATAQPDLDEKLTALSNTSSYKFFQSNTGNVEVQKEDETLTIYFPIQPVTRFLTATTQERFQRTVPRESNQHKITDLIARTPEFLDEMDHLEERSHDYIKITPARLDFFRDFSTVIAIAVSFIVVGYYRYARLERADGSSDYRSHCDPWPRAATTWLGYCQLVTSVALLVGSCLNRINIIVKSGWRKKVDENRQKLQADVKHILKPLEPPFGELRAKDLPLQAARVLLLTEGPDHHAFVEESRPNFGYVAVDFEQKWIGLSFVMQDGGFLFILFYLAFSLQGLFQSPIFYSFHLLDMVNRFPQLQSVIQSVTLNGNQLLMTAMLGFIIIYIYSAVAFIFLFDTFYDDQVHAGLLNRKGDSICQSMMHCFLSTINYGLRGGGGIGEFLPTQTAAAENRQGFYFRSAYDLTFFLLVITILLNIIFGIIIDTFAQLRDQKGQTDEDSKNVCFICGISRQAFDRDTEEGFEWHTVHDHDVWQYVNFIIHLKAIPRTDLNGTESYILELFEKEDISWFPMQRSLRLARAQAARSAPKPAAPPPADGADGEDAAGAADPRTAMQASLLSLEEKVREVTKRF